MPPPMTIARTTRSTMSQRARRGLESPLSSVSSSVRGGDGVVGTPAPPEGGGGGGGEGCAGGGGAIGGTAAPLDGGGGGGGTGGPLGTGMGAEPDVLGGALERIG